MNDDDLKEIEARSFQGCIGGLYGPECVCESLSDVPKLIAEVRKLHNKLTAHKIIIEELMKEIARLKGVK